MSSTTHNNHLIHSPKNLGKAGYLLSLYSFLVIFSHPFVFLSYGLIGYFVILILNFSFLVIDYFTSDATKRNLAVLRQNGFSYSFIFFASSFNFVTGLIPNYIGVRYLVPEDQPYFISLSHILPVVVNLAITDVLFYLSHRHLHQKLPHLHVLHHCCRHSSSSTNILFHPMDLAIEFTGPALFVFIMCIFVWKDPMVLMFSLAAQATWYSLDHDEYLRLPHWYHHTYINSNYPIYTPLKSHDKLDGVRALINFPEHKNESYEDKDNQ